MPERWTFGYLIDVILTRDTWMHRVDLARAAGLPLVLTAGGSSAPRVVKISGWVTRADKPVPHLFVNFYPEVGRPS